MLSSSDNKEKNPQKKKSFGQTFINLFTFKKNNSLSPQKIVSPKPSKKNIKKNSALITAYLADSFGYEVHAKSRMKANLEVKEKLAKQLKEKEAQLTYQPCEDIVMPEGYTLIKLTPANIEPSKDNGILLYDIDDTILKFNETVISNTLVIHYKPALLKELKLAKEKGFLIGILTARMYSDLQFDRSSLCSAINILEDIDIDFFHFIIFTNHRCKDLPMLALSHHYNFPRHQLCLVEDDISQMTLCSRQKFKIINVTQQNRHAQVLDFLSFPHKPIYEKEPKYLPLLPAISEKVDLKLPPPLDTDQEQKYLTHSAFIPEKMDTEFLPPLEKVTDEIKRENELRILHSLQQPMKACFIFTNDWVDRNLDMKLDKNLINFLYSAHPHGIAFILILPVYFDENELKKFLLFNPIVEKHFFAIAYTEDPSYEDLLDDLMYGYSLLPRNVTFVGNDKEANIYADFFGFNKVILSENYVSELITFAEPYIAKNKVLSKESGRTPLPITRSVSTFTLSPTSTPAPISTLAPISTPAPTSTLAPFSTPAPTSTLAPTSTFPSEPLTTTLTSTKKVFG